MNDRGHLSAFDLDRLLLESLLPAEAERARAHLDACPECRALFDEMQADQAHFRAHVLPRTAGAVEDRALSRSPFARFARRWRVTVPAAVAASCAVALAVVAVQLHPDTSSPELGIKGGPTLQVYAARGDAVFRVTEGTHLKPGDRIRFVVDRGSRGDRGFLLIASLDGAKKVSIYHPPLGEQSVAVGPGRVELPGSIELDATTGPEHLFAFFSAQPLTAQAVRQALAQGPEAPPGLDAELVVLGFIKDPP